MTELTDKTIDSATTSGVTVVDFYAEWCPPCKMLSPIFDKTASMMASQASFYKMDAESNPDTVIKHQVNSLPTILIFKDGAVVDRQRGLMNQSQLETLVKKHI